MSEDRHIHIIYYSHSKEEVYEFPDYCRKRDEDWLGEDAGSLEISAEEIRLLNRKFGRLIELFMDKALLSPREIVKVVEDKSVPTASIKSK